MNTPEAKDLKLYEITNCTTGEKSYQPATNAEDACKQAGWQIGVCFITEQKPRMKPLPGRETRLLVKIPCRICPYQYGECVRPATELCPARSETPDLIEWTKQAATAHLCPHTGESLTRKDYNLGKKWCPMDEAVNELSRRGFPPTDNPPL